MLMPSSQIDAKTKAAEPENRFGVSHALGSSAYRYREYDLVTAVGD